MAFSSVHTHLIFERVRTDSNGNLAAVQRELAGCIERVREGVACPMEPTLIFDLLTNSRSEGHCSSCLESFSITLPKVAPEKLRKVFNEHVGTAHRREGVKQTS